MRLSAPWPVIRVGIGRETIRINRLGLDTADSRKRLFNAAIGLISGGRRGSAYCATAA